MRRAGCPHRGCPGGSRRWRCPGSAGLGQCRAPRSRRFLRGRSCRFLPQSLSHVRVPGEPAVLGVRGLGREAQHHRLGGRGGAVFHRLVDHHRCCREISSSGRLQPFLPRLWGDSHHRIPDDQRRVQRAGAGGQLQRGLSGPDRGSHLALHWLHDGLWVPHCLHVDPLWGLRG
uniref:Uncharacterized protein n=1 Tax=Serinus canaria TaxID=9135 RepID=A0A8C9MUG1_SERCA